MLKPDTLALTALLAVLAAFGPISTDMYLPSLPSIGRVLGAPPAELQLTLSVYLVGFAVGQLVYGPVADRRGRKPALLTGLGLYVVASLACAMAPTIETLIACRALQAFGAAGPIVLARSIVRDLYEGPRAGRELARIGMIMGLVPSIAPSIGGILETTLGWRANFYVTALVALAVIAVVMTRLPETLERPLTSAISPRAILGSFGRLLRHRGFRAYVAVTSFTYSGLFAFISGSSFVLQDLYGLSEIVFGIAFGACALSFVTGTIIAQSVVRKLGLDGTIRAGGIAMTAGGLAAVCAVTLGFGHPATFVAPVMTYFCGVGLALPQSQAAAMNPFPAEAGSASSLIGFVQMALAAIIGIGVGRTIGTSALPLALAIAGCGIASLAAHLLLPKSVADGVVSSR